MKLTSEELSDLLARVEAATEPDTMLDHDIEWALGDWTNLGGWWRRHKVTGEEQRYTYFEAPRYTASIDAALALVDRLLKTYSLSMTADPSGNGAHLTWWPEGLSNHGRYEDAMGAAVTLPLAILAALLRALSTGAHP